MKNTFINIKTYKSVANVMILRKFIENESQE